MKKNKIAVMSNNAFHHKYQIIEVEDERKVKNIVKRLTALQHENADLRNRLAESQRIIDASQQMQKGEAA